MTTVMPEQEVDDGIEKIEDLFPYEPDDGNKDRRSHIVRAGDNDHIAKGDNMDAMEIINAARLMGEEVVALCGYRWVPSRNPKQYPICDECMKRFAALGGAN